MPDNYSFLEDLYRSPVNSYQTLQTQQEQFNDMCLTNQALEEENKQLKEEVTRLKEEVKMLRSGATMLPGVPAATPTKIKFLKELTSALEDKIHFGMRANNESSGNPKIKLVDNYDVFLTQAQLSQANHKANGNARKLVIGLLDTFFTRDRLAGSSALGAKSAHNKKDDKASVPLPAIVLSSMKQYVLRLYKRPNGEPCLADAVFNDIINQKCATARRSLKTL